MFRRAILDAAEEAFAASGFHGAHMQEIARRAGLAVGTIYNHFGQKEDVLLALLEQRIDEMAEVLRPEKGDPKDYAEKLAVRLERVLAYRDKHAAFFALAVDLGILGDTTPGAQQVLGGRSLPHVTRMRMVWLDLVEEGIAAKALEPLDRELLAALLKSTLRVVARWSRDHAAAAPSHTRVARIMVDVFLNGVARRKKDRKEKR